MLCQSWMAELVRCLAGGLVWSASGVDGFASGFWTLGLRIRALGYEDGSFGILDLAFARVFGICSICSLD